MKYKYVIGLNSGTSFDGIDVSLVRFKNKNLQPIFAHGIVYDYPKKLKRRFEVIHKLSLGEISQLNFLIGELFAKAALKIIKRKKLKPKNILLIASHGQTIFHDPGVSTLQIGESSIIAQKTGIKTISNFREADIQAGGQGAPLMPYLDWIVFNKSRNIKAMLNIGGISNVTIVGNNITPIAFDIGPGNALIDLISKRYFKKDFDKNGTFASKGKINFKLVEKALRDLFFKKKPPKSTGKEYFNFEFIQKYFSKIKKKEDKLATVTYLSARAIEKALYNFVFPKHNINEMVISGGGIKNKVLMKHLKKLLPNLKLISSDKYRLPAKYKEAMLFAILGYTCLRGIKNNMPSCTGAKKKVILGKITKV